MRVLIETAFIISGLVASVVIASLAAWSYPLGKNDIWLVAYAAMVIIVLMGIGPLRRAYAEDRARLHGTNKENARG
jgi:type IV secretory pathway TrbD component